MCGAAAVALSRRTSVATMPLTIPKDREAKRPTCPECKAEMVERQSIVGDQREASTSGQAMVCPDGHRVE